MITVRQREQLEVSQQAITLRAGPFVAFDTETTGFAGEIIQIGIVDPQGRVLMNQLIKPTGPILNSDIHGITNAHVADAPSFPEVHAQIAEIMAGQMVLAYNLAFDRGRLAAMCKLHQLPDIPTMWRDSACVMEMFARFFGEWNHRHQNYKWQKLRTAMAYFGIPFDGESHDAIVDIVASIRVLDALASWSGLEDLPF